MSEDYSPDETYEKAHYPTPERLGGKETIALSYYDHAIHGLYQSKEFGVRCFFNGVTHKVLYSTPHFCENWFELCDVYEEFAGEGLTFEGRSKGAKIANRRHDKTKKMNEARRKPISLVNIYTNEVVHFTDSTTAIKTLGLSHSGLSMLRNKSRPLHKGWSLWE